ncbi:MAG: cell division protein FtsZ [Ignavibacteria bacterium]
MAIQLLQDEKNGARIKVVGVGGGGGNIVTSMVNKGIEGVEFIIINTDAQALELNKADVKIAIGKTITKGLGTGMKYEIGKKAVEENRDAIERHLQESDMVFVTAGMGGGTGTGGAPEVARIARAVGALVVAVVTKPFAIEGEKRMQLAEEGIEKLREEVDSLIVIPNEKIMEFVGNDTSKNEAFDMANRVLYSATRGISQIITKPGTINVDFEDVRTIMKGSKNAMIGTGIASGKDRAIQAASDAIHNPLLDDMDIAGAKNVLYNIVSNGNIPMKDIEAIGKLIREKVGGTPRIIMGLVDDEEMGEDVMVTVIATGFESKSEGKTYEETISYEYKITTLPGADELGKLDTPAIERRFGKHSKDKIPTDFSEPPSKIKNKTSLEDKGMIPDEDITKPAFLRKQMD